DRTEVAPTGSEVGIRHDLRLERLLRNVVARFTAIPGQRPVAPDRHALLEQRTDIGLAGQEPQHLARRRLPVDALGGDQRHPPAGQVTAYRRAEDGPRAHAGAVDALAALGPDAPHEVEILPFPVAPGACAIIVHEAVA